MPFTLPHPAAPAATASAHPPRPLDRITRWRPEWRVETLALALAVYFTLIANTPFWSALLSGRDAASPATWGYAAAVGVLVAAIHFLLLALLLNRWTARPLAGLLLVLSAAAAHFMARYHIYLDPDMLRNVLRTDPAEAGDLLSWALLGDLVWLAGPPLLLLARLRLRREPLPRALLRRAGALALALLAGSAALFAAYRDLAPAMRNQKETRYLITPANFLYSLARATTRDARAADAPRAPIGEDAALGAAWAGRRKPALFVLVLGETARAANWGLNGYARDTTPELARVADLISFAPVTSCGSNTEVSVPCLFSPWGRRQYDEERIRGSESLLDVARRAGFSVAWIDNQSGCKGVCRGVGEIRPDPAATPELCDGGRCLDGALLPALEAVAAGQEGNLLVVLHLIGNHGPAYYKRYPPGFAHFTPACTDNDLARCPREAVVNAYDNALRYTDHVLARTIDFLRAQSASRDTAFLYVSDHGESLGENGIYLHGLPYAIAPAVQTQVPMALWLSPGWARDSALDTGCLARRAHAPAHHDHVFHTVLGLLDIQTTVYERDMDLAAACRQAAAPGSVAGGGRA